MKSFRSFSAILTALVLGGLLLTGFFTQVTQTRAESMTRSLENGVIVSEPFYPVDTTGLPPAPAFDPDQAKLDGFTGEAEEFPGALPIPTTGGSAGPDWADPALQSYMNPIPNMPAPIQNWEGMSNVGIGAGVLPPDTDGQVGPNHYVQIVNHGTAGAWVRVWDKTGTQLYDFGMGNLWPGGDPCNDYASGDPVVVYDQMADRWLLTQFTFPSSGPYYECIAVSQTPVPTNVPGDWHLYTFAVHASNFPDYPKFGVWPDGYYMMAHQFLNASSWAGTGVWVFDRAAMLVGGAATFQYVDLYPVNPNYGGMLPSNLMGNALPPTDSPNYYVEADMDWSGSDDVLTIFEAQANWPSGFTFTVADELVVDPFVWPVCSAYRGQCIHQPGTSVQLEAISDRLMMHAWYRNMGSYEVIVASHTVDAGSNRAGIRWYEIRKDSGGSNWYIFQQGTYAPPDGEHRWMGSIAMDHVGNIALGYSLSSSSTYPSIHYTGRLASDPLGTLPQGEETIIVGSGSQTHSAARWGDYSAMSVDPVDDCTFWYTQEYIETTGSAPWQTRVASFKFPNCTAGPAGYIEGTVYDDSTLDPISGASVIGVSTSPTKTFGTTTNPSGYYWAMAPAETYTVTALAYGYAPAEISGVSIVADMTTTLDIPLTIADYYTVSGAVTDATTGWPLYASIDIDGYPGDPLWTDPVSGYYEISLPEGVTFTFDVEAWVPGYSPTMATVGPLTADVTENFALEANSTCTAPGYSEDLIFYDGFESGDLSAGWVIYTTTYGRVRVDTYDPYMGAYSALLDSSLNGQYATAAIVLPIDLSGEPQVYLDFWWREYGDENDAEDGVFISDDAGATWCQVFSFNNGPSSYINTSIDLTSAATGCGMTLGVNSQIMFQYYDNYTIPSDGYSIDEVRLQPNLTASCLAPATGGLVVGNVYDDNTTLPLNGAMVENEIGDIAEALETPLDDNVDDAFYTIFGPATGDFTATMGGGYTPAVETVTIVDGDTVGQDFYLLAGWLDATPDSMAVTLDMGMSNTLSLDLDNMGGLAANFEFIEADPGFTPLVISTKPLKQEGKNKSFEVAPYARRVLSPLAIGDELFQIDVETPTGDNQILGMEYLDGYFWATGGNASSDPNRLYKFDTDGNLVATYDQSSSAGWGWRDLADDGTYLYGSDSNVLVQIDPATGLATGTTIPCPENPCRALAYDPATDHFWTANFSSNIYEFDRAGTVHNSFPNSLAIYGMAWDVWSPGAPYLWVWSQDGSGTLATQIDPATGNPTGIAFAGVDPPGGSAGGAAIINGDHPDFPGMAIFGGAHQGATVDSIVGYDLEAVAGYDIPWLSEDPITGTVPALDTELISVTFDAGVPEVDQPGDYMADLRVLNDTPYGLIVVPVTMTVNVPPTWGKLNGTVTGLGYCDANPELLEEAVVVIEGALGTYTTTTDVDGYYQWWLDEANSPVDVTVTYPDYEVGSATATITAGATTQQDFDLRWLFPCVKSQTEGIEVELVAGYSTRVPISITNTSPVTSTFAFVEQDGGYEPPPVEEPGTINWLYRNTEGVPVENANGNVTMAYPGAYRYTPDVPSAYNALIYADDWVHASPNTYLDQALQALGIAYTAHYDGDFTGFESDLASGTWDLVLYEGDNYSTPASTLTALNNYVLAGGKLGAEIWDMLNNNTNPLYGTLGVAYVGNYTNPTLPTYWWDPTHAIFTNPESAPEWPSYSCPAFISCGQYVDPVSGVSTVLAGYTASQTAGQGALIIHDSQNTVFKAFLDPANTNTDADTDGKADAVELWTNIANGLTVGFGFVDAVPWVSEEPITGTLLADSVTDIAITFDASVTEVVYLGSYYATLNINSDDPISPTYSIPVTMTVVAADFGAAVDPNFAFMLGEPSETVTYTLILTNTGNVPDTFDVTVSGVWTTTAPLTVGPIMPGESEEVLVTVEIPADAMVGDNDSAIVTFTSQGDPTEMADATLTTLVVIPEYVRYLPITYR